MFGPRTTRAVVSETNIKETGRNRAIVRVFPGKTCVSLPPWGFGAREDPSRPVVCIVRARSYDGTETGRRELLVPPAEQTTVQVTTLVKTSAPAVVGDVYGCGTEVPSYLVGG